jgi:hypothetical protein
MENKILHWVIYVLASGGFMCSIWSLELTQFLIAITTATILETIKSPWEDIGDKN